MSATIDNSNAKKYAAKTSFTYVAGDGKEYVGISMRTGKIVDSTQNKTYASLEKWLESLPGSPTIDRINIKEPEVKKAKEKDKSGLKSWQFTFDKLCPTYDMALLLFAHEQYEIENSITSTNNKYKPSNIYLEDANDNLVLVHYHRWKVLMARDLDIGKKVESTYFEGIGIKPDTKLYISVNHYRKSCKSSDDSKLICYKPPFTRENWKEYICRPFIFYSDKLFTDEEKHTLTDTIKKLEESCNIIKISGNRYHNDSISIACDVSTYHQLFDKSIVFYKAKPYDYYNGKPLNTVYYIVNHSIKDHTRAYKKSESFEETITNLKKACNIMLGITE